MFCVRIYTDFQFLEKRIFKKTIWQHCFSDAITNTANFEILDILKILNTNSFMYSLLNLQPVRKVLRESV